MASKAQVLLEWMEQKEAAKALGISVRSMRRLAEEGKISRRELRHKRVQYHTVDVERMKGLFLMQRDGTPVLRRDPPPQKLNPGLQAAIMSNALARMIEEAEERRAAPPAPACPTAALDLAAASAYKGLPAAYILKQANEPRRARRIPHWRTEGHQEDGAGYYFLRQDLDAMQPMTEEWQQPEIDTGLRAKQKPIGRSTSKSSGR